MNRKRTSDIWKPSKDDFIKLMMVSNSVGELLENFGLTNKGNNYKTINARCNEEGLEEELINLKNRGIHKNRRILNKLNKPRDIKDILVEGIKINRGYLKKRLLNEGWLKNKCSICGLEDVWNNLLIVMILDHINGISDDYRFENLRMVCPNCNSQLPTFTGRNSKVRKKKCLNCKNYVNKNHRNYCDKCFEINRVETKKRTRKFDPTEEELKSLVWQFPMKKLKTILGVSDRAIRRRCKIMNIDTPPTGYWARIENK